MSVLRCTQRRRPLKSRRQGHEPSAPHTAVTGPHGTTRRSRCRPRPALLQRAGWVVLRSGPEGRAGVPRAGLRAQDAGMRPGHITQVAWERSRSRGGGEGRRDGRTEGRTDGRGGGGGL